eukprot:GHRR01036480.1.p1 GENE.GHRR01036480.1~~GHRR01036480.1.p1  ORF type:complete len:141 (-),score=40.39 GHRR01036480.1:82-504(-)
MHQDPAATLNRLRCLPESHADMLICYAVMQHPLEALRLAMDPTTAHPVDIALVNGEVFMNLATAGPVSEVSSKHMSHTLKKVLGPVAVAVAGFRQLFITGLPPIKGTKIIYPTSPDSRPDDYRPDQVRVGQAMGQVKSQY